MLPEGTNPGSINTYRAAHPDLDETEALRGWEEQLQEYRGILAAAAGVTVQELHAMHPVDTTVPAEKVAVGREVSASQ